MAKTKSARGVNAGGKTGGDDHDLAKDDHPQANNTTGRAQGQASEAVEHAEMCRILAIVCNVDMALKGGYVGKVARQLRLAGYTVADVRFFWDWWGETDWRGRNNEYPRLGDVLSLIRQSRESDRISRAMRDGSLRFSTDKKTGELVHYALNADGARVEIARSLPMRRRGGGSL